MSTTVQQDFIKALDALVREQTGGYPVLAGDLSTWKVISVNQQVDFQADWGLTTARPSFCRLSLEFQLIPPETIDGQITGLGAGRPVLEPGPS